MVFLLDHSSGCQILLKMFQADAKMSGYLSLAQKLQQLLLKSFKVKAVLAFIVLLDCIDGNFFQFTLICFDYNLMKIKS